MVKGWYSESVRHSLAAKGIKTGKKKKKPEVLPAFNAAITLARSSIAVNRGIAEVTARTAPTKKMRRAGKKLVRTTKRLDKWIASVQKDYNREHKRYKAWLKNQEGKRKINGAV